MDEDIDAYWTPIYDVFDDTPLITPTQLQHFFVERERSPLDRLREQLRMKQPQRFILSGHTGSGKTTELRHFVDQIKQQFYVVFFNAETNLDAYNVGHTEVLIAIGLQVHEQAKDLGIPKRLRENLLSSLASVEREYNQAGETGLAAPKILEELGIHLKRGYTRDERHRLEIGPVISRIIKSVNAIIADVQTRNKQRRLVVIVDGLDKIDLNIARTTFSSGLLTELQCHVLYTVPLAFRYSLDFTQAMDRGFVALDLPNMPVYTREGSKAGNPAPAGRSQLKEVLEKRIATLPVPLIITPGALALLVEQSGGLLRDLIRRTLESCIEAKLLGSMQVDEIAVERAILAERLQQKTRLRKRHYELLLEVQKTRRLPESPEGSAGGTPGEQEITLDLLRTKLILNYQDGTDSWFDVHPLIIPLLRAFEQELPPTS